MTITTDSWGVRLILLLIAMAETAVKQLPLFSTADAGPVTITQDNADLVGAGTFTFKAQPDGFDVDPPADGNGLSLIVRLHVNADGSPISCDIGQAALPKAAKAGCAQLMKAARFQPFPGFALPFRQGFLDVEFSFFKDVQGGPKGRSMFAFEFPGYVNTKILYPDDNTPPDQVLSKADGSLVVPVMPDDYPPIAIRYAMESRSTVRIGISRDGTPRTCRPITTPSDTGTAYLDNYTCHLVMRRGHFQFESTAPAYDGLRYVYRRMSWKMPT